MAALLMFRNPALTCVSTFRMEINIRAVHIVFFTGPQPCMNLEMIY